MQIRPLTEVASRELRPLLDEETDHWAAALYWDYQDVSSAVAGGLDRQAIAGRAIQDGSRTVAYCYYLVDSGRVVVGSLFASTDYRGQGLEERLLDAVLAEAQSCLSYSRVECQTLFSTASHADTCFEQAGFKGRARHYLVRSLSEPIERHDATVKLRPLRREDTALAADIIYKSHRGSLDAALNLTYATPRLCRGFVDTLVLRAGCGRFESEASFVAQDGGRAVGVLVASRLAPTNGHICQVSVIPEAQSRGTGSALVSSALEAFRRQGLSTASLSVTRDNARAHRLYQKLGFVLRKPFAAHAWVRPPARLDLPN